MLRNFYNFGCDWAVDLGENNYFMRLYSGETKSFYLNFIGNDN